MGKILSFCHVVVLLFLSAASVGAAGGEPHVLFDQGHNQRFLIEEKGELHLSGLAAIIRERGAHVSSTSEPLRDEVLNGVTALVISGPFEALHNEEVAAIIRFIQGGGRFVAMLHIGSPFDGLLERLDLDHSNAVLHERTNIITADTNFRVSGLSESPLFSGLTQFSVYGAWALNPGTTTTSIARTSTEAWVDLDGDKKLSKGDISGLFSVAVSGALGAGRFVVFGDDAIFQNRYLDENNHQLAINLAAWLSKR